MTKDEALRLALEALETSMYPQQKQLQAITAIKAALANEALERKAENARELGLDYYVPCCTDQTCPKCKAALEAKDEPVAWMYPDDLKRFETSETFAQAYSIEMVSPTQGETVPLYKTPQKQPPVIDKSVARRIATQLGWEPPRTPLPDEEIRQAEHHMVCGAYDYSFKQGVKWAEKSHGIKWEWER